MELYDAILADPSDDDLRRVWADQLCERGDPRGEFIQLQYARLAGNAAGEAREHELLSLHGADWLGPLVSVVEDYRFERGFVASATVPRHRRPYNIERVVGHPLWATVEALVGPPAIFLHPVMRSLRVLATTAGGLRELCDGDVVRPIRALTCNRIADADLDAVATSRALPALRDLDVSLDDPDRFPFDAPEDWWRAALARYLTMPVMARLSTLALRCRWRRPTIAMILETLDRHRNPPTVTYTDILEWTVRHDGTRYRLDAVTPELDAFRCDQLVVRLGVLESIVRGHHHLRPRASRRRSPPARTHPPPHHLRAPPDLPIPIPSR